MGGLTLDYVEHSLLQIVRTPLLGNGCIVNYGDYENVNGILLRIPFGLRIMSILRGIKVGVSGIIARN